MPPPPGIDPAQLPRDVTIGAPAGCIYCGAFDGLQDEHVIPFGLGGRFVLEKASCPSCAKATALIEQRVVHDSLAPFRAVFGLPTRRKRSRLTRVPVRVRRDGGDWIDEDLPIEKLTALAPFPKLLPPGVLDGRPLSAQFKATGVIGVAAIGMNDGEAHPARRAGAEAIRIGVTMHPAMFMRLLAKIAWGIAVAQYGLDRIEPAIIDIILMRSDHVDHWVGCPPPGESLFDTPPTDTFRVNIVELDDGRVVAAVQLFGPGGAPEYWVVVGRLR